MSTESREYTRVLIEVEHEIHRAKGLHPGDFHSIHEGFAVLDEERDELWDLVKFNPKKIDVHLGTCDLEKLAEMNELHKDEILRRQKAAHRALLREEAIQLAAMAVRFAAELT